jgi:hypothetical protein
MGRRPRAVRLAIPALFVAILTFIALWRVSAPVPPAAGGSAASPPEVLGPLTHIAEVLADNSVGRQASLERVMIRDVPSARTLWIGDSDDDRVFVVLDPDVKNLTGVPPRPGSRVTLLGLVRAAPTEETAMRQWAVDAATAKALRAHGTYLHVTEIKPSEA